MGDGNSFPFVVWLLLVILACKSIVLCKCSGKYIDIYFSLKITYLVCCQTHRLLLPTGLSRL